MNPPRPSICSETSRCRPEQPAASTFGAKSGAGQESALFYTIYLFQKAFQDLDFGYASAMAWVLFAVILAFSVLQFRLLRGHTEY